jgi:oligopeptide transport system substrate-binding protein
VSIKGGHLSSFVTRKRALPLLAAAVLVLAAAGCGKSSSNGNSGGNTTSGGAIPNGGTMTFPLYANPVSMTPLHGQESEGVNVEKSVFAGLVDYDPETLDVVPSIAKSWEANSDNTVFTFHLRSGVKFQPGANGEDYGTVTADTFVKDWGIACAKSTASEVAYILAPVQGFSDCQANDNDALTGVKAIDDTTLQVTLSSPFADFPSTLGHPVTWAFPPQLANTAAKQKAFEKHPVGAGPFMFDHWTNNKEVVIKKFPGYFGTPAHLDEVDFQIYPDADEQAPFDAFKAGQLDVATIPSGQVRQTKANSTISQDAHFGNQLAIYYYGFDLNDKSSPLSSNLQLRQALAYATNSAAVVNNVNEGVGSVADGLVPPGIPGYKPGQSPYTFDTSKASDLLQQSGESGTTVTLSYNTSPGHQRIAEALAQGYKDAGINIKLANYEWGTYLDKLSKGELEFFRLGWIADYPTMDNFIYPMFESSEAGNNNVTFYKNPDVDQMLAQARATADDQQRYDLYNQIQQKILADAPEIPIYFYGYARMVSPQVVNFQYDAMGVAHFALMGIDKNKPAV